MRADCRPRCILSGLAALLLAPGIIVGNTSNSMAFSCPHGTRPETRPHSSVPAQVESCRDTRTGLHEGPTRAVREDGRLVFEGTYRAGQLDGDFRTYDEKGRLSFVIQYSNGKEIGTRMTRAGLEAVVSELNMRAREKSKNVRWAIRDNQTVEIVTTVKAQDASSWNKEIIKEKLAVDPRMCAVFKVPSSVQTVVGRFVNEDGKELSSVPITRADCPKE